MAAADPTFRSSPIDKAEVSFARRVLSVLKRFLRYGPHAVLAASVFGLGWAGGSYVFRGQFSVHVMKLRHFLSAGQQESAERAELLNAVQKMSSEIRTLKADVEAMRAAGSSSARDATALESMKKRLDALKTETSAAIAELTGKVDQLQRGIAAKRSQDNERSDPPEHHTSAPPLGASRVVASASGAAGRPKGAQTRRSDAFDPSENPGAPGAPRPLGAPY